MPTANDPRLRQAMSLYGARRAAEAAALCRQVLAESPAEAGASLLLARIARESGAAEESVRILQAARSAAPAHPAIEPELAISLVVARRAADALPILAPLAAAQPNLAVAQYWLGQAYLQLARPAEGVERLARARALDPHNPEISYALGAALIAAGRPGEAEQHLRAYLGARPAAPAALVALASSLELQNRANEAAAMYRQALERSPGNPGALTGLARHLQAKGDAAAALALLEPAVADRPDPGLVSTYAALCVALNKGAAARPLVESALGADRLPARIESALRFALARIDDASDRCDEAFANYRRANDLAPHTFDPAARRRFTDAMIAAFPRDAFGSMPRAAVRSDRPVIVCGMPRSGTTLVEQIIASHPQAFGAGELPHLRAAFNGVIAALPGRAPASLAGAPGAVLDRAAEGYLRELAALAPDAARVVDKMPHNAEILGFIALLLPDARIISCVRDPMDTCLSCYTTEFSAVHSYAARLDHLAVAYAEHHRLMEHWKGLPGLRMLEVSYESLVDDLEPAARRILEFLGLPWDDRCLRFYENARLVSTASVDQVRRPIYRSSVGRWRRYERHLAPLRDALRAAGIEA
ncbi:MAG TPA: sulfotransferase [Phycisphaerales bacterium]|nr:sulfotransferase [Phycisphaerales bacterium]